MKSAETPRSNTFNAFFRKHAVKDLIVVLSTISIFPGAIATQYEVTVGRSSGLCPQGFFECGNSSQCLEQSLWCNGVRDCDNGYDETYHACHYHGAFSEAFFELHTPIVGDIENDTECVLASYPEQCLCVYRNQLDCWSLGLKDLPSPIPDGVTNLMFQKNQIRLRPAMFKSMNLHNITYLYLAENEIENIPRMTFDGLPFLSKLSLESNRIRELHNGMFYGLENLHWLNLGRNVIESIEADTMLDLPNLIWLILDFNYLMYDGLATMKLPPNLLWFHAEGNLIDRITPHMLQGAANLNDIFLRRNLVRSIDADAFASMSNLWSIDLSCNYMTDLNEKTFYHNRKLKQLSLANNTLLKLPLRIFSTLENLESLDLNGITIDNIDPMMFDNLKNLSYIHMKSFEYCRYAIHVRHCTPKSDGLSDFYNLLASPVLRISIWIIAIVTLSGNFAVIVSRFIIKEQHRIHAMFLRNLAASDFLMGIYLMIIAIQDSRMFDVFNKEALSWVNGHMCKITGIIAMTSTETSLIILMLLAAERFVTVVYPLKVAPVEFKKACCWLCAAWVVGLLLSIIPLFFVNIWGNFYGSNTVCLPLHIHEPFRKGWHYSSFIFVGVHFAAYFLIATLYIAMSLSISKTRRHARGKSDRYDYSIASRFTLIILTNTMCWLPIAIVKVCALMEVKLSEHAHAWLTVLILPINSSLDPLIYSLTTPMFLRLMRRSLKVYRSQHSFTWRQIRRRHSMTPMTISTYTLGRRYASEVV